MWTKESEAGSDEDVFVGISDAPKKLRRQATSEVTRQAELPRPNFGLHDYQM